MKIIGCDFHTRYQQIAMMDEATGELIERRLDHGAERHARSTGICRDRCGWPMFPRVFSSAFPGSIKRGCQEKILPPPHSRVRSF